MKSVKAGDLLTTKYGSIILVEHVEFGEKNAAQGFIISDMPLLSKC